MWFICNSFGGYSSLLCGLLGARQMFDNVREPQQSSQSGLSGHDNIADKVNSGFKTTFLFNFT